MLWLVSSSSTVEHELVLGLTYHEVVILEIDWCTEAFARNALEQCSANVDSTYRRTHIPSVTDTLRRPS
jgi:hypothetical protein